MPGEKKVGINGVAGRIGKFTAYEMVQLGESIGAVNDLAPTNEIVESLAHRDGVHGTLDWRVERINDGAIAINGSPVRVFHERDPANIAWGEGVNNIAECTGFFTKSEDALRHTYNSPDVKAVLISAPGKDKMTTLVMGVNHTDYRPHEDRVISNASCTTKALAVPLKALMDAGVGIYAVLMDTTHAATNTQRPLDFMAGYGVLDTIQSAKTGAAIATGEVIPYLAWRMDGFAMRVPTRDGSFANIYMVVNGENLDAEGINARLQKAKDDPRYAGRLDIHTGSEIASPDIIGNTASAVVALAKTRSFLLPFVPEGGRDRVALVGLVSGYDNERGPSKDLALLTQYVAQRQA